MIYDVLRRERMNVARVRVGSIRLKPAHTVPGKTAERYIYENGGIHKAFFKRCDVHLWRRTG